MGGSDFGLNNVVSIMKKNNMVKSIKNISFSFKNDFKLSIMMYREKVYKISYNSKLTGHGFFNNLVEI